MKNYQLMVQMPKLKVKTSKPQVLLIHSLTQEKHMNLVHCL